MRGGFLRFQAQYLRRIRIPRWAEVSAQLRAELAEAAIKRDLQACNRAVFKLYGLSSEEQSTKICQKLVQEQLYSTAALITSPRTAAETGEFSEMSAMTGLKTFVTALAGHIAGEAARLG
jgi:hypothetical protein